MSVAITNRNYFDAVVGDPAHTMQLRAKGLMAYSTYEGRWLIRRMRRLTGVDVRDGADVLDLGGGHGYPGANLLLAGKELRLVALDISRKALRGGFYGDSRRCVQADAIKLPFATGTFDLVFGRAILHHLPDVGVALAEVGRVLRRGGYAVFIGEPAFPGAEVYRRFKRSYGSLFRRRSHDGAVGDTPRYVRASYSVVDGCVERVIQTGCLAYYANTLCYPFLIKLGSRWLCDICHEMMKWQLWIDDQWLRHIAPQMMCEQILVIEKQYGLDHSILNHG